MNARSLAIGLLLIGTVPFLSIRSFGQADPAAPATVLRLDVRAPTTPFPHFW